MDTSSLFTILLIEDSPADVKLFQIKLRELKIKNPVAAFRTGEEALEYLDGRTALEGKNCAQLPGLIFLDDRLPEEDSGRILKKNQDSSASKDNPCCHPDCRPRTSCPRILKKLITILNRETKSPSMIC